MTPPIKIGIFMDDQLMLSYLSSLNNSLTNNANVLMASNQSDKDRAFSREMSDLAWQRNIEAWNKQNWYNLPANAYKRQLEGLKVNGLNPNLVYGNSSSVSGAAGSVSPFKFEGYHSTAVPQFRGDSMIQDLLSTKLLQTQVAAQEAQNRLINARADNEELRSPGIRAKSDEAAYRWRYITDNILDSYDAAIRANQATEYWKGQTAMHNANLVRDRSKIAFYEASMAEWLNTTKVPGTDYTYQQYYERYKALIPQREYVQLKASILNIASEIAYRKTQGELLDLKKEYQRYVNRYAALGRTLGNDWVNTLISGLMWFFNNPGSLYDYLPGLYELDPVERGMSEPGNW